MLKSIWGLFAPAAIWPQEITGGTEMCLRSFSARYQEDRCALGGIYRQIPVISEVLIFKNSKLQRRSHYEKTERI